MSQTATPTNVFDAAKAIVEVLKDLDKPTALQAIRFASESLGLAAAPPGPTESTPTSIPVQVGTGQQHSTDIKQFTAAKDPKSDQQFAAVVAYFYRFEAPEAQRRDTIDQKVLRDAARLATWKRPLKKPLMTLQNAKKAGYLDTVGRGAFRISSVGENLVAVTLPGSSGDAMAWSAGRRKAKRGTRTKRGGRMGKRVSKTKGRRK